MSNRARHVQEAGAVTTHLDDVPAVLVYAVRTLGSLLARAVSDVVQELYDLIKRVLVIVPDDDGELVVHERIACRLQAENGLAGRGGHEGLVRRGVQCVQDEVNGIANSAAYAIT